MSGDFTYSLDPDINFADVLGWGTSSGPRGPLNVETQDNVLSDEGGFFGSLGDVFSDVVGAVTQGYDALTQLELAKYQARFGGSPPASTGTGTATGTSYSPAQSVFGVEPHLLLLGGAALILVMWYGRKG